MKKTDNIVTTEKSGQNISVNKLIGEIALKLAGKISKENDANGVAQGYRAILFSLVNDDGVTQYEISKRVGIRPSTTSVALSKMEQEGYIERKTSPSDLRKTIVTLTKKGRDTVDSMLGVFFYCDELLKNALTDKELTTLINLLSVVKERICTENKEKTTK